MVLLLWMLVPCWDCWSLPAGISQDPAESASVSASSSSSSSSSTTSNGAQLAAAAANPAPDMALRNAFNPRNAAAALVGPGLPVSPVALRWCSQLNITAATLQHWQAGMAVVTHPNTQQQVSHQARQHWAHC